MKKHFRARNGSILGCEGDSRAGRPPWVVCLLALAVWLGSGLAALAVESGTVAGQLTVGGESTPLQYVYAFQKPGFFDKSKLDSIVILSNMGLPAAALDDPFERMRLQREGGLACVELTIDTEQDLISVSLRHANFKISPSGNSTDYVLELERFDGRGVAGKVHCKKEQEFADVVFRFDATFDVAYDREEEAATPATAAMEAAAASPQAAVYRAYEKAVQNGDLAALKKLVTDEVAAMMDDEKATEMMAMLKAFLPTDLTFLRLSVDGDSAELILQGLMEGEKTDGIGRFVRLQDEWRLAKVSWK
ncbi:MAG: hypothetical protein JXQ27_17070 [Acidobacteria bacterium]|nr:hypothetical protein [Acidobacteriota bacterium]